MNSPTEQDKVTNEPFTNIDWSACDHAMAIRCASGSPGEIQHLLEFVGQSACMYERNGEMHTGKEAAAHIQKKYDYYKDDVKTAEDFVRLSATQSLITRKKYKIYCPDETVVNSADWLLEELVRFRADNSG